MKKIVKYVFRVTVHYSENGIGDFSNPYWIETVKNDVHAREQAIAVFMKDLGTDFLDNKTKILYCDIETVGTIDN